MKVRAKANGNVTDLPDAQARDLIASGIYEAVRTPAPKSVTKAVDDEPEEDSADEPEEDPEDRPPGPDEAQDQETTPKEARRGRHKRRDMRAED